MKTLVRVSWKDTQHDWEWFYLLGSKGEMVNLQGANDPIRGVKHCGNSFWVHHSEIKSMDDATHPAKNISHVCEDCGSCKLGDNYDHEHVGE